MMNVERRKVASASTGNLKYHLTQKKLFIYKGMELEPRLAFQRLNNSYVLDGEAYSSIKVCLEIAANRPEMK